MIVNIYEAKSKLSQLLAHAQNGEDVIIAKAGKPVAYLKPVEVPKERQPGRWAGEITFEDDWDEPLFSSRDLDEMEQNLCEPE